MAKAPVGPSVSVGGVCVTQQGNPVKIVMFEPRGRREMCVAAFRRSSFWRRGAVPRFPSSLPILPWMFWIAVWGVEDGQVGMAPLVVWGFAEVERVL